MISRALNANHFKYILRVQVLDDLSGSYTMHERYSTILTFFTAMKCPPSRHNSMSSAETLSPTELSDSLCLWESLERSRLCVTTNGQCSSQTFTIIFISRGLPLVAPDSSISSNTVGVTIVAWFSCQDSTSSKTWPAMSCFSASVR